MMHDVVVVGAGPAGLYLAWLLARERFDVAVVEEHPDVGSPVHCTGIFAVEAFDEFCIPRETILNELTRVRFFAPSGENFEYTTEKLETVVVDRKLFDYKLSLQAQRAGAKLLTGSKAIDLSIVDDRVIVKRAAAEPLQARVAVLACGADYGFQRRLGLGVPSVYLQTAQVEVPIKSENQIPMSEVELYFGRNVAPKGFAWTVRVRRQKNDSVRIGVMCDRNASLYFDRFFQGNVHRWQLDESTGIKPLRKILPLCPVKKTVQNRLVLIGDAAGIVKPTTGGGIYYSIVSAALAAEVLVDGLRRDQLTELFLSGYAKRWRERFGSELRAQLKLRRLAERLEDWEIDNLFHLAKVDGLLPLVRRTARFNQHRELISALLKRPDVRRILVKRFVG